MERGLFSWPRAAVGSLFYKRFEVNYLASDDIKAGAPEAYSLNVYAEAVRESGGVSETGRGEDRCLRHSAL